MEPQNFLVIFGLVLFGLNFVLWRLLDAKNPLFRTTSQRHLFIERAFYFGYTFLCLLWLLKIVPDAIWHYGMGVFIIIISVPSAWLHFVRWKNRTSTNA